ncbi:SAM-dependent methyltransferase [Actinoplanes sp. CA-030573]|uniref:SAM-dependent methyltransferase n=1 Tax=Actinoplanes sp. CA-030573 TaxID=3239898 RepID=UPI003D93E378
MGLSRQDMITEIVRHRSYGPILRVLAAGPRGYAKIRVALAGLNYAPGDGQISASLSSLRSLGLIEQRKGPDGRRLLWTLTEQGTIAVKLLDAIVNPEGSGEVCEADQRPGQARNSHLDSSTAHPARRYNYWLGSKDNFAVDRESGDLLERAHPAVRVSTHENRAFLQRVVGFLTSEAGIDQFLDIGSGLPTADNTHQVAQRLNPRSAIVYVDNDPMVMTHARALLTSTAQGHSCYIEEDLRDPERILNHPDLRATLDLDRPVALILAAVLHFLPDHEKASAVVKRLVDALPSGSYLAASHFTLDYSPPGQVALYRTMVAVGKNDGYARSASEFGEFFTGLELLEPQIVPVSDWRPKAISRQRPTAREVAMFCAVGRKR